MTNGEYIRLSLELHLFFDRIMKEHSFFLWASFTERDKNLKEMAKNFQNSFSSILKEVIFMSSGNLSNNFLTSNEMVTKDTLDAELKTNELTGSNLDTDLTKQELNLNMGMVNNSESLLNRVHDLNLKTLPVVENLIMFKNNILNKVLSCKMYTTNYPLLITHIMNEAKMYRYLLKKLESRSFLNKNELYEQELFWDNIMKEHAEFIRGLLDPSEEELIRVSDNYAKEYEMIIKNNSNNPGLLTSASLSKTTSFRDFKVAGEEGILNCKIKSIITPLLADHVVREANHFIRILKSYEN